MLSVHGRGQSPEFMASLSERLSVPDLVFYAPSAANNTWYPNPFLEPLENNEPDLSFALAAMADHVETVQADGFPPGRIVLWGFSQGACLLSHFLISTPAQYAGAVLLTGGYIGPDSMEGPTGTPLAGVPIVLRSIEHDPWVPRFRVEETAALLEDAGAQIDIRISPGNEHIITTEAMAATARLLNSVSAQNI